MADALLLKQNLTRISTEKPEAVRGALSYVRTRVKGDLPMYILTTLLRFTVLAVIVLSVLQLGVFTLFPDRYAYNLPVEYGDLDGELALRELQAEILHHVSVLAVDTVPGYIARQSTEMSLEERQKYLGDFRRAVAAKLREIGMSQYAEEAVRLFIEYMNERGIYFE